MTEPDARDFFVNQATSEGIGNTLTDEAARLLGRKEFAILTGALSAANQNEWISFIKKRVAEQHSGLTLSTIRPTDDDRDKAFRRDPDDPARPSQHEAGDGDLGAGRAGRRRSRSAGGAQGCLRDRAVAAEYQQALRPPPTWCRPWSSGTRATSGYLTIHAGLQMLEGKLGAGAQSMQGGRLGQLQIRGSEIILGPPLKFTKANIDQFDF